MRSQGKKECDILYLEKAVKLSKPEDVRYWSVCERRAFEARLPSGREVNNM